MNLNGESIVYCDANFLATYFIKNPQQHDLQNQTKVLFAQMLVSKCRIATSPLAFDEAWNSIRKIAGPKKITDRFKYIFNQWLQRTPFQLRNGGVLQYSYSEIIKDLINFTNNILNHQKFSIVQLINPNKGVLDALGRLNKLKPRDAFHLVIALDNGATHFIGNDVKLIKDAEKSGLTCCNFNKVIS